MTEPNWIEEFLEYNKDVADVGSLSDGSHSYKELYYHRMVLFATICNQNKDKAWKSKKHDDDTMFDNYFIVGIDTPEGSYTYHYELKYWSMFKVKVRQNAPKWDGHIPDDVTRLLSL